MRKHSFDPKCLELAEHFLGEGNPNVADLAQRFQDVAEEPQLVRCTACINGRWETECCNGSSGCSCRGQVIDMGRCNVCRGTGWRDVEADVMANARSIEGLCYIGSGPRR